MHLMHEQLSRRFLKCESTRDLHTAVLMRRDQDQYRRVGIAGAIAILACTVMESATAPTAKVVEAGKLISLSGSLRDLTTASTVQHSRKQSNFDEVATYEERCINSESAYDDSGKTVQVSKAYDCWLRLTDWGRLVTD